MSTVDHGVPIVVANPTSGGDARAMSATGDSQPSDRRFVLEADRDDYLERLDAVAGSEYVDDRIRLQD